MSTTTEDVIRSSDVKLLLLLAFVLVVVVGVIQGAFFLGIIAGCLIFIGYAVYLWTRQLDQKDTRLEMIERRLDRIEKKLFE